MHDEPDHDAPRTADEILEEWKAERPQIEAEMAARAEKIRRDEALEWAKARQAAAARPVEPWRSGDTVVTKGHAAPAAATPASLTADWQRWIEGRIRRKSRRAEEAMCIAIRETVGKDLVAEERRCAALRKDVDRLTAELAELKGELKTRAALAEVTERLERLEAAGKSAPIRLAG